MIILTKKKKNYTKYNITCKVSQLFNELFLIDLCGSSKLYRLSRHALPQGGIKKLGAFFYFSPTVINYTSKCVVSFFKLIQRNNERIF